MINQITSLKAYAKINLYLKIIRKLNNNYHEIQTLFGFCNIYDQINVYKNDKNSVIFKGPFSKGIKKNNTIEYLFPKIFRQIQSSVKDQFLTNNELVTISTVFPFQSGEIENNDPIIANDFSWKIISILPVKNFILTSLVTFNRFTVFYLLFLLTGCVVSYIFARSRAQRVKTRNQITESEAIMNLSLSHSDIGIWDLNLVSRKLVYHKSWY